MSAAYTAAAGDVDQYLRATATYTDTTHSAAAQTATATVGPVEPQALVSAAQITYEASTIPQIISAGSFTVDEGNVNVGVLAAYDDDTVTADLTWSLSGGDDQSHFTLTAAGVLAFSEAKDFESPDDDGTDGTYEVTVQVSDGDDTDTADIEVTLADVDETSTAPPAPGAPGVWEDGTGTLAVFWCPRPPTARPSPATTCSTAPSTKPNGPTDPKTSTPSTPRSPAGQRRQLPRGGPRPGRGR